MLAFLKGRDRDKHIVDLLNDYIDGRVSVQDRARVEAHLPTCPSCREELESLMATVSLLKGLPPLKAPRSFALSPLYEGAPVYEGAPARYPRPLVARGLAGALASFLIASSIGVFLLTYYAPETPLPSRETASLQAPGKAGEPGAETEMAGPPAAPAPALRSLEAAPGKEQLIVTPQAEQQVAGPQPKEREPAGEVILSGEPETPSLSPREIGLWMFFTGLFGSFVTVVAAFLLVWRKAES